MNGIAGQLAACRGWISFATRAPMNLAGSWLFADARRARHDADRVVEVAWLPLWQCQLALHDLWENEIPATMAEDHTSMMRFAAREPMGSHLRHGGPRRGRQGTDHKCIGIDPPKQDR